MRIREFGNTFRIGVAVLALALPVSWAIGRGGVDEEPAVGEALIEESAVEESRSDEVRWDLTVTRNERVEYWIDFLKGRNHERTRLWLERSGRYGPMIRAQLRERGMPEDLLYLALIESGFSPRAYSRAHASGIWQFIEETGRRYGLRVTNYLDERRDPIKSTTAALDYLEELYERFGSWYLAAAAYNTGENRVDRILRQRAGGKRGDDSLFWKIAPHLPRETRDYVPLMLAAGHIAKEPEKYGFEDLEYQAPLDFETVSVPGGTSLRAVARAAELDLSEVKDLNPQFVRSVTPPGSDWSIRLPRGRGKVYAQNFGRVLEEERLAHIEHRVRRGETLSHIARRYGTTVAALREANAGIRPNRIIVGQRIMVPAQVQAAASAPAVSRAPGAEWTRYRVRRGDSLWRISRRYGVSVRELQAWNGLGGKSKIVVGQSLRIRT